MNRSQPLSSKLMRVPAFYVWLWWTRFLDVVKPRRDYTGSRYPRVHTASPAEAERIREILRRRQERDA